ncbi:MAG: VIT1/CCC1 transporter family protein [Lewinellaceae bacterium]|nr:VIT1/CCC1 transporter family protein [Lewinellaceae bacterium]
MINPQNIQTEIDAAYLYDKLAAAEKDEVVAQVLREMHQIELGHANAFWAKLGKTAADPLPAPSRRARILNSIGRIFGYNYVMGVLLDTEKSLARATVSAKQQRQLPVSGDEGNHVQILKALATRGDAVTGSQLARFESRHRTVGGNALRAAVLGGNDGLVSNFSLVMGVAGATAGGNEVLLAGTAGLLAGALSMALGEWISVKSSQELNENQMQLELEELETNPEGEMRELALIYVAKGIPPDQAQTMAQELMQNKTQAHQVLVREELGLNPDELEGSALEAAGYSFLLFAIGAVIPLLPFFWLSGMTAILVSTFVSALGLFGIGAAITLFTGKSVWFSGFRQVLFGLAAAAITFGIGHLIGVSLAG